MGKRNPFSNFMFEFIAKERAAGREYDKAMWAEVAGEVWRTMSDEEKARYKPTSDQQNANNQSGAGSRGSGASQSTKYSSQGVPLDEIEKNKRMDEEEQIFMERYIKNMVSFCMEKNELGKTPIFFIMANYFYKLNEKPFDYLPAEIAIGKFSLENGEMKKYHSFINPGKCEIGYAWSATEHSQKTHRLPIPPKARGEKDYDKIYGEILDILGIRRNQFFSKDDKQRPRVFVRKQDIEMIKSVLKQIAGPINWNDQFDVWEFEHLFYVMKNAVEYDPDKPDKSTPYTVACAFVDKDKFDLNAPSCDHHDENDVPMHCAQSHIYRLYYLLVDHVAERIGITLEPGKHLPRSFVVRKSIEHESFS